MIDSLGLRAGPGRALRIISARQSFLGGHIAEVVRSMLIPAARIHAHNRAGMTAVRARRSFLAVQQESGGSPAE